MKITNYKISHKKNPIINLEICFNLGGELSIIKSFNILYPFEKNNILGLKAIRKIKNLLPIAGNF